MFGGEFQGYRVWRLRGTVLARDRVVVPSAPVSGFDLHVSGFGLCGVGCGGVSNILARNGGVVPSKMVWSCRGLGSRVSDFEFQVGGYIWVKGFGVGIYLLGIEVWFLPRRVVTFRFTVCGFEFRVSGPGFRVSGLVLWGLWCGGVWCFEYNRLE